MGLHGVAALSLFALALVGGLAPLGLRDGACVSEHRRRALFALSTCFSGGLLMGASLIHLLPGAATINKGSLAEVIGPEEELGGAGGPEENEDYPLSYLLCGAAFLVLMLVDSSLRLCLEHERTDVGLDEMDLEHGAFLGHFSKYMHGQPCTEGRGHRHACRLQALLV